MNKIREKYPALDKYIYLDTATTGLYSNDKREIIEKYINTRIEDGIGIDSYWSLWDWVDKVRIKASNIVNSTPNEVFFGSDSSMLLNVFVNSIKDNKRKNIIIPDISFPSTRNSWLNTDKNVVYAKSYEKIVSEKDIIENLDENSFALSICSTEPATGYRYDLELLGKICKERDIYFIVDATQDMGAISIDFRKCNIDYLVASTYKWLLSPFGLAVGYINSEIYGKIKPINAGWTGVRDRLNDFNKLSFKFSDYANKFETGGLNWSALKLFENSIDDYLFIGKERVENHIKELNNYLYNKISEKTDVYIYPKIEYKNRSGIIYIKFNKNFEEYKDKLISSKIKVNFGKNILRLSIHYYNNKNDIDIFSSIFK